MTRTVEHPIMLSTIRSNEHPVGGFNQKPFVLMLSPCDDKSEYVTGGHSSLGTGMRSERTGRRPPDPQLSQPASKRFRVEAQQMSGPLVAINSPLCALENLCNMVPLKVAKVHRCDGMLVGRGLCDRKQHLLHCDSG